MDIKENEKGLSKKGFCLNNVLIFSAGIVVCNWLVIFSVCITLMCTFDPTGRTFVKLKATRRRQRNLTTYTLRYQQAAGVKTLISLLYLLDFTYQISPLFFFLFSNTSSIVREPFFFSPP